jgi:fumarylpyruvate hydrolase
MDGQFSGGIIGRSTRSGDDSMKTVIPMPAASVVPVAGGGVFPVRRIYCVGRNYVEHAREMGFTGREPPFFFMKPADAVVPVAEGEIGVIDYPSLTKSLHHEIELVVALGSGGSKIAAADAFRHVYGYAVGLDMTRRDLQGEMKKQGRPWCIGKAFDQSAPIGPIHPAAVTGELTRGAITLSVNGQVRQTGDLSQLIWSVGEIIEHLSSAWTLAPGDLIYTGTPAGVAAVVAGDLMHGAIDGLGSLRVAVR